MWARVSLQKKCMAVVNESVNSNGVRIGSSCNVSLQCQVVSQGQKCR